MGCVDFRPPSSGQKIYRRQISEIATDARNPWAILIGSLLSYFLECLLDSGHPLGQLLALHFGLHQAADAKNHVMRVGILFQSRFVDAEGLPAWALSIWWYRAPSVTQQ